MKIIVNKFGTKLSLKQDTIIISNKDEKDVIPIECISEIVVSNSCLLTTDIIFKCIQNNIIFQFLDKSGQPYLNIENLNMACSPIIKRKQLLLNKNSIGVKIIKNIIISKIKNRNLHLKKLAKNRKGNINNEIKNSICEIKNYILRIENINSENVSDIKQTIQAYEGNAGKIYFNQISKLLKPKYQFKGRSHSPSKDFYNCMLNYSYGIMYNKIKEACINAKLDPYIGIMHSDIYNKPTLTYDLIEPYRYHCEEVVFKLFSKCMVSDDMFYIENEGYYLNENGKKLLFTEYYKNLNKKVIFNKKNISLNDKIKLEILSLAKFIGDSDIC